MNSTKNLASSYQYDFRSLFLEIKWVESKDMHRAGMLWGSFDVNLTNSTYKMKMPLTDDDSMAGKFFFGLMASKLMKNWNRTIINSIRIDPFDVNSIIYYLQIISNNIYDRWYIEWYYAVYNIYYIIEDTMTALFPAEIPENMTSIYEFLNETKALYSDVDLFSNYVDNAKSNINLTDYLNNKVLKSMRRDNSSAGFLWGKFNYFIANISVKNTPSTPTPEERNTTEDRYSRELLRGLLETTMNQTVPLQFLNLVNSSVFNYKQIVNGFKDLAFNGYNFSRNHTDEERYTESVGVLSLNLRNVLMLSFISRQKEELVQELNTSFVLFKNHSDLLEKIRRLFEKNIDIRYYFQTAYEKAQYHSEFFLAGRIWGESVKVLLAGSNGSNTSNSSNSSKNG